MVNWLKRFTLSLFSNKQAKENLKFGFGNILLTSILSIVFIFLGIFAGEIIPFAAYYNGADDFREFIYNAVSQSGLNVISADGKAQITSGGKAVRVNTVSDNADFEKYCVNGYHLFVDSSDVASVIDDFYAYCVTSDGKTEIPYEEYLQLSEAERGKYKFAVRYSGVEKNIEAAEAEAFKSYLSGLDDENVKASLNALEEKKSSLTEKEYNNSLYSLYVQNYYPDMYKATGENVPTLRTYYYLQTLKTDGRYLCIFGDMLIASFNSYGGNNVSYGGTYKAGNNLNSGGGSENIDAFIKNTYYDGAATTFVINLINGVGVIAITELIIVAAMLVSFIVCQIRKSGSGLRFANSARLVASYSHVAALITALLAMIFGFTLRGTALHIFVYAVFAAILVIRTLILLLTEKKEEVKNSDEEIFTVD